MRLALDTNILAYAEGVNGAPMRNAALELVQRLPEGTTLLPVQTLGSYLTCSCAKQDDHLPKHVRRSSAGKMLFLSY